MEEYSETVKWISRLSVFVPLLMYFTRKKIKQPTVIRELLIVICLSGVCDFISWWLIEKGYTNQFVGNSYIILTFCVLSVLYYRLYIQNAKRIFYVVISFVLLFALINSVSYQSFMIHQTWTWTAVATVMFLVAMGFYRHILKDDKFFIKLHHYTPYWINTGVFIYFGFSLWLFAVASYILAIVPEDQDVADLIWSFHNWNNFIKNMVFTIALYYAGREPVSRLDNDPYKHKYFKADTKKDDKNKKKDSEETKKMKGKK